MKIVARRKPNMTLGCNHKSMNLATMRDCEEGKDAKRKEDVRRRTSARFHAGDIDQCNQIQQLNSALLHTPEQGTNSATKRRLVSRNGRIVAQIFDKNRWM